MIAPQYRPIVGGYERAAERLSIELVRRGHSVTVVTDRRMPSWPAREVREGVLILRLWCIFRPRVHLITALLSLTWYLLQHGRRFDIWHVHTHGPHAMAASYMSKIMRRPLVLKLTSSGTHGVAKAARAGGIRGWATFQALKGVSAVVALTQETAAEAIDAGIQSSRVHQLGNGVDAQLYRPRSDAERTALKPAAGLKGQRAFVSVGRLIADKNVAALLEAWAAAQDDIESDWRLVIVGDGPLRENLEGLASELGIQGSVIFAGQQSDVDRWLGAAEVYVSTSDREGLSNTLLEAMSTGLPSVATRVSGVDELIVATGAGIAVEIGDVPAIRRAIVDLASAPELRRDQGQRARTCIEARYSVAKVAALHEDVYLSLANQ